MAGVLAVIYNPFDPLAFGGLWPWVNALSAVGFFLPSPAAVKIAKVEKLDWIRKAAEMFGKIAFCILLLVIAIVFGKCVSTFDQYLNGGKSPTPVKQKK